MAPALAHGSGWQLVRPRPRPRSRPPSDDDHLRLEPRFQRIAPASPPLFCGARRVGTSARRPSRHDPRRQLRPGQRSQLDVQHHARRPAPRTGGTPATPARASTSPSSTPAVARSPGLERAGQGRLRAGPLARIAGPEPARPRHERPRHVHGRPHRRPRRRAHARRTSSRLRPTAAWRPTPASSASRSAPPTAASTSRQVIAAIDWVVQHQHDNGLNIRVLNLSYGTNSTQSLHGRPARLRGRAGLEARHRRRRGGRQHRLPAGQRRPRPRRPRLRPVRDRRRRAPTRNGTARRQGRRRSASFSASGPAAAPARNPDIVAPGRTSGPARPGLATSTIDTARGSLDAAASAAAAPRRRPRSSSGAAALILQKYPDLTPDQVKAFLTHGHRSRSRRRRQGPGQRRARPRRAARPPPDRRRRQQLRPRDRHRLARDLARHRPPDPRRRRRCSGEIDIFGHPFDSAAMAALGRPGRQLWSGGYWNGNSWSGNSWSGNCWSGNWSGPGRATRGPATAGAGTPGRATRGAATPGSRRVAPPLTRVWAAARPLPGTFAATRRPNRRKPAL